MFSLKENAALNFKVQHKVHKFLECKILDQSVFILLYTCTPWSTHH